MPPQIDRQHYMRNANEKTNAESPPPKSIVSEDEILRRGCPGAPKAKYSHSENRKRYRPTGFFVINDDECDDDAHYKPLFPRQIYPICVEGLPKPKARRVFVLQLPRPQPSSSSENTASPPLPDAVNFGLFGRAA